MKATVKAVTATEVLDSVGNVNRKATDWVHGAGPYFVGQSGYWQFSPYIGVFGGLKEGAQWSGFDYQNVGICSRDPTCSISAKVAGREKVQVPAGTFEAWKVVVDYRFRVQNVVAAREFTYWYADEIKRFVKYTTRGNAPWDSEVDIDLLRYELD